MYGRKTVQSKSHHPPLDTVLCEGEGGGGGKGEGVGEGRGEREGEKGRCEGKVGLLAWVV